MFELQGHRGARGVKPENTLVSFETALDVGVASIETDIHLTLDGVPILCHDPIINERIYRQRVSFPLPSPPLWSRLTLEQVRCVCADGNPDPRCFPQQESSTTPLAEIFARARGIDPFDIPTLADLFAFTAAYACEPGRQAGKTSQQQQSAREVILDLELKRVPACPETIGDVFSGTEPGLLERRVVAEIDRAGMSGRTRVRSFDHRAVAVIKKLHPSLATAVLLAYTSPISPAQITRQAGAEIYCPHHHFVNEEIIRQAHAEGIRVMVWTVNDPADWDRLLGWNVDGITTDYPDRLARYLFRQS